MHTRGLTKAGLTQLHEDMAALVGAGRAPGMVLALSRGDDVHVDAIGAAAIGDTEPIRADALFRITSLTRPITAVATLLLVREGWHSTIPSTGSCRSWPNAGCCAR
ncbi:MAG: serine hydrolase [Acidimicrobiales bacterium]|nr:serine hydrolase [Acidimicrobiales bacterium]